MRRDRPGGAVGFRNQMISFFFNFARAARSRRRTPRFPEFAFVIISPDPWPSKRNRRSKARLHAKASRNADYPIGAMTVSFDPQPAPIVDAQVETRFLRLNARQQQAGGFKGTTSQGRLPACVCFGIHSMRMRLALSIVLLCHPDQVFRELKGGRRRRLYSGPR